MQNSFCSTNSSIMRLLSSTPQKNREYGAFSQTSDVPEEVEEYDDLEVIQKQENQLQNDYLTLIEKAIKFKQFIAQKDDCVSSVTSDDVLSNCEAGTDFNDKSEWNENSNSENSSLNCHQLGNDVGTMTEIDLTEDFIQDKTQELESELNLLREESLKVTTLKTQLEQQQKEFEKLRKEAIKQVEDEKRNMNKLLEEEKKKLAKDKMVFERYIKDLQNKPSRKERAEISALKAEIATLKETLKVKESKNGMTQARLRNQIKTLEKDNSNLKEEIENLNRQNARLTVNQKVYRKPSDTKMLHEINRNLTKLAQTKFNKLRDSSSSDEKIVETKRNTSDNIEKENDKNMSNKDDFIEVEKNYEEAFNENQLPSRLSNGSFENTHRYNRTEETLPDGRKEVKYSNGNVKIVSPDGNLVIFKYYNGDVKETNLIEGTICYYYNDSQIKHTTNVKGSEIIEFPDGQIEERFKDGTCNIRYPNGISRKREDDGTENITYPDGTIVTVNSKGERVLLLPNGQKEIHTNEHKRREYPDGTVKILFPDGSQETRYASGRVRLKDRNGMLLMDTESVKTLT